MLDLKRIRFETEAVRDQLAKRGDPEIGAAIDALLQLDKDRRELLGNTEQLKALRNEASRQIADLKTQGKDASAVIDRMRDVADQISRGDERLGTIESEMEELLLVVPNTPLPEVPAGDQSANEIIKTWGEPLETAEWRKPHWELASNLGLIDLERGAKLSGSGFPVYLGAGARLARGLISLMLDLHVEEHGYTEVAPPFLVTRGTMTGTAQLPKLAADAYRVESDDLWLIPTAEVPVTNLHAGEVLAPGEMPRHYVACTPCFRREAGAAGRETRGINRVHQFDKVELVRLERPEDSAEALEDLTRQAEAVLQRLGLAYRVTLLAAGDVAQQSAKTYDLEVWAPGAGRWLEVSSCSNCTDYQARRANIRFRQVRGAKPEFVHTLNGSALALPRTMIALLEAYQSEDGAVDVPEALLPFVNFSRLEPV